MSCNDISMHPRGGDLEIDLPGSAKPAAQRVEGTPSFQDVPVCSEKKDEFLYHLGYPKYWTDFGSFSVTSQ